MVWDYSVTEPGEFGSKSTSYLVTVTTDLAEYGAGAAGAGPGEGNGAGEAKGAGEAGLKVLQCRRRYSDFDRLHKALRKLVGVKALPKYPAKALFNRFNDKVIQDRIAFFLALLKVVADSEALQRSEPVLEFVCKVSPRAPPALRSASAWTDRPPRGQVPEPDYEEVKELVLEKARWVLSLPEEEWTLVGAADQPHGAAPAEKGAAVIKMRKMENSRFRSIKSTTFIPRPYKAVAAIYDDHRCARRPPPPPPPAVCSGCAGGAEGQPGSAATDPALVDRSSAASGNTGRRRSSSGGWRRWRARGGG